MRILQSMLTALVSAPTRIGVLSWLQDKGIDDTPEGLAGAVLSATGEVSSLVYAARLLDRSRAWTRHSSRRWSIIWPPPMTSTRRR